MLSKNFTVGLGLKMFLAVFALSGFLAIGNVTTVYASDPNVADEMNSQLNLAGKASGLGTKDPREAVTRLVQTFISFLGIIFVVYIVYAGYLWMTAGGDNEQIKTAQKHIKNGVIGLIIVLVAYSITLMVSVYLIRATANKYYQIPGAGSPQYQINP